MKTDKWLGQSNIVRLPLSTDLDDLRAMDILALPAAIPLPRVSLRTPSAAAQRNRHAIGQWPTGYQDELWEDLAFGCLALAALALMLLAFV